VRDPHEVESASIRLCRLDELPDRDDPRDAGEFESHSPYQAGIFVVRAGRSARAYVNRCPHLGSPLNWSPDRFLDLEKEHIVCATHGAVFRIEDGACLAGPCAGDVLEPVALEIRDGVVYACDWLESE